MDFFDINLPVAGIEINVLVFLLIGFSSGVMGGFFGMGGGWMITPTLYIFGFRMAHAVATGISYIPGMFLFASLRHRRMGNVDGKLAGFLIASTVVGLECGTRVMAMLDEANRAGPVISVVYVVFLTALGAFITYDFFKHRRARKAGAAAHVPGITRFFRKVKLPPVIHFKTAGIDCSFWVIFLTGAAVGFLAGIMGVGGGIFCMPALIYVIGCPTVVAVGTVVLSTMVSATYGLLKYAAMGKVEIFATVFMLAGATVGAQLGASAVRYVRGYSIRILLAVGIFSAVASLVLKQSGLEAVSGVFILAAVAAVTFIVLVFFVRGMRRETGRSTPGGRAAP